MLSCEEAAFMGSLHSFIIRIAKNSVVQLPLKFNDWTNKKIYFPKKCFAFKKIDDKTQNLKNHSNLRLNEAASYNQATLKCTLRILEYFMKTCAMCLNLIPCVRV